MFNSELGTQVEYKQIRLSRSEFIMSRYNGVKDIENGRSLFRKNDGCTG